MDRREGVQTNLVGFVGTSYIYSQIQEKGLFSLQTADYEFKTKRALCISFKGVLTIQ